MDGGTRRTSYGMIGAGIERHTKGTVDLEATSSQPPTLKQEGTEVPALHLAPTMPCPGASGGHATLPLAPSLDLLCPEGSGVPSFYLMPSLDLETDLAQD